jgi:MerR family transcriptional regulator, light-induced transcriptional regulator
MMLTPKELADAIGASESSLRRWIDNGRIAMSRTVGGHRRIPRANAIQFIREIGATVVRPELLGLGVFISTSDTLPEWSDDEKLFAALTVGDRAAARGMILSWYLGGKSLPALFDGPIAQAMHRMGELWKHQDRGILIEHRATEICIGAVAELRELLPAVDEQAPLALGGGPQNDPYMLPTMMAGTVLAAAGFREVNFGPNTPVELLLDEAIERRARLVWLSISTMPESKSLRNSIEKLAAGLQEQKINLVIGGRGAAECSPRGSRNVSLISSMSELAAFAKGVLSSQSEVRI